MVDLIKTRTEDPKVDLIITLTEDPKVDLIITLTEDPKEDLIKTLTEGPKEDLRREDLNDLGMAVQSVLISQIQEVMAVSLLEVGYLAWAEVALIVRMFTKVIPI